MYLESKSLLALVNELRFSQKLRFALWTVLKGLYDFPRRPYR